MNKMWLETRYLSSTKLRTTRKRIFTDYAQWHPWKFANRLLSCRSSSSVNSLEDDRPGARERGAARSRRSEISTLWNSMGWFMTAISHQWRHTLPRVPFGQHELARTDVQVSVLALCSHFPSPLNAWQIERYWERERELSFQLSLSSQRRFLPLCHRYSSSYTFLFCRFYGDWFGIINRGINCFCVVRRRFVWSVTLRDEAEIYFSTWIASQAIRAIDCRTVLPRLGHDIRFEVTRRNNSRAKCSSCKRTA